MSEPSTTPPAGTGTLVLVATPIGNLGDLAPRAVDALAGADVVLCEDTRRTGTLLTRAAIRARRLVVANAHTEAAATAEALRVLGRGGTVAVVTDAGTPGISDPGERLVRAAIAAGHTVTTVPGPSAVISALVVSGLPTDRFVMEGFLPRKGRERTDRLAALAHEPRTVVLYEAPHRLARTLADLAAVCGPDRPVVLARELTKLHEEVWRGTLAAAEALAAERAAIGEYVVVLGGAPERAPADDDAVRARLAAALGRGDDLRSASAAVAAATGRPRREVYDLALEVRRASGPARPAVDDVGAQGSGRGRRGR